MDTLCHLLYLYTAQKFGVSYGHKVNIVKMSHLFSYLVLDFIFMDF